MASTAGNLPKKYRYRAEEARQQAQVASDEAVRRRLLHDADMWERMAAYEERHRTYAFPACYPPAD